MDVCTAFFVAAAFLNLKDVPKQQCNPLECYIVKTAPVKHSVDRKPVVFSIKNNRKSGKARINVYKSKSKDR